MQNILHEYLCYRNNDTRRILVKGKYSIQMSNVVVFNTFLCLYAFSMYVFIRAVGVVELTASKGDILVLLQARFVFQ